MLGQVEQAMLRLHDDLACNEEMLRALLEAPALSNSAP